MVLIHRINIREKKPWSCCYCQFTEINCIFYEVFRNSILLVCKHLVSCEISMILDKLFFSKSCFPNNTVANEDGISIHKTGFLNEAKLILITFIEYWNFDIDFGYFFSISNSVIEKTWIPQPFKRLLIKWGDRTRFL